MITDITGTELIPGNCGLNCPGNGFHEEHPCCCDECDYMMCCLEDHNSEACFVCSDLDCPNSIRKASLNADKSQDTDCIRSCII